MTYAHASRENSWSAFGIGLVVLLSVIAGGIAAIFPYWLIVAIAAVPIFFVLVSWRLEYGLLGVLALASGILNPIFLPRLPLLGAGLDAADLSLIITSLLVIVGGYKLFKDYQRTELNLWSTYLVFLIMVALSVIYARFFRDVPLKDVLGEGRDFMYLLLFPISVAVLNSKDRVRRFLIGLMILGVLFSLGQILQGVFHIPIFGGTGRMETVETLGIRSYGATRTLTRGINIILFVLFMIAGWYILKQIKTFKFLALSALTAIGILLTFGRTTWAVTLLGIVIVIYLLGLRKSWRMLIWSFIGAVLALGILVAVKPAMLEALVDRATSVNKEIKAGSSVQWRYYEASVALPQLIANPILGLGLGATYRKPASSDVVPEEVRYIHDGYLYMATKLGVPGLLIFIWFLIGIFRLSLRGARQEQNLEMRAVYAAICAGVINILVESITQPDIMGDSGLAYIAIMAGLTVSMRRHATFNAKGKVATQSTIPARSVSTNHISRPHHV